MGIYLGGNKIAVSPEEIQPSVNPTIDNILENGNTATEKELIIRSQWQNYTNETTLNDGGLMQTADDGEGNGANAFLQNGGLGLGESSGNEHSSSYYGSHHMNLGYENSDEGIHSQFSFEWGGLTPSLQITDNLKKIWKEALEIPTVSRTATATTATYNGINCGEMNWTCIKTKINDTDYHYHWFGRLQNTGFAFQQDWTTWGQVFLSQKFRIPLPNSDMVGKCLFNICVRNLTMWQSESFNVDNYLDIYAIRATQPGTSTTTLQITVHCDYIST